MTEDFSRPRRQSPIGIVVMFFDTIRQSLRALWPVLVLMIVRMDSSKILYSGLALVVFLAVVTFIAYLKYRNFTFWLDEQADEFVISEGVLNKTRTAIRLGKIQQVNINQSLIQRVIGVYAVEVDSAGSSTREGSIKAISHDLAVALKARLLENRRSHTVEVPAAEATNPEERFPLINISFASLLKVGFTTNYVRTLGLLLAFVVTIYDNVNQYGSQAVDQETIDSIQSVIVQSVAIVIGILFLSVIAVNVIRMVVQYFGFTITRQKGSLLLSFGLLSTRSTIIKPEKVQITAVTQNYLQRKLDVTEIRIRQAAQQEQHRKKQVVEIPGCDTHEKNQILELLLGRVPEIGEALRPNIRKLIFDVVLWIGVPVFGFAIAIFYIPGAGQFSIAAPLYVAFVGTVLFFSFRNYRLFISPDHIIKQSGAWDITREIIEPAKIQSITVRQLFWHRALDIASLTLHTAGGDITFSLGKYSTLAQYVNLWLYEIEGGNRDWG